MAAGPTLSLVGPEVGPEVAPELPTYGDDPGPHAPNYIKACYRNKWKIVTWRKSNPDDLKTRTARCCSWRHGGDCQRRAASEDYARIKEALERFEMCEITYCVLTLDPSAWSPAGWSGPAKKRKKDATSDKGAMQCAYRDLGIRWTKLARTLRKEFSGELEYVTTVEAHRSGWPHLNVVIVNKTIGAIASSMHKSSRLKGWSRKARGREVARELLGKYLIGAGFGPIGFIEQAMGKECIAGYIAKLAGTIGSPFKGESAGGLIDSIDGQIVGEIIKSSQVPHEAPRGFHRLRSSRGFLPKKHRDPDITGALYNEYGQRIGERPVQKWIDTCHRTAGAPMEAIRSIERQIGKWIEDQDLSLGGKESLMLREAIKVLRGETMRDTVDPPPVMPAIEPTTCEAVRSIADVERLLGPWGPAMTQPSKKYRLNSNIVYAHSNECRRGN